MLWWVYERPSRIEAESVTMDCGRYQGGIYNPRFGNSLCALRAIVPPSVVEIMCIQDIACQPVVFAEYLRQVLQAGRSVLSLPRAVGE